MKMPTERIYNDDELAAMVTAMEQASSAFYAAACQIGNHPFIEFTGLMNEYIKICQDNAKNGQDFTLASIHAGQVLEIQPHQKDYLLEKLECIFGTSMPEMFGS